MAVRESSVTRRRRVLVALVCLVIAVAAIAYAMRERVANRPGDGIELAVPSPPAAPLDRSGRRTLSILGAGDILVHPQVWQQARRDGGRGEFDFFPMFEHVSPAISEADLAICHLEVPLATKAGPFEGFPTFNVPPQVTFGLKQAGFDACSTASNHVLDQGEDGVVRTLDALDASGLGHSGSYRSKKESLRPTIYTVNGVQVGHLSYALHFNGEVAPRGKEWLANRIDPARILAAARKTRQAGAEIVVLSLHWGTEYQHDPDPDQDAWAQQLIGSPDIDVVLGHHAHVVQPFALMSGKWVVFGMGNQLARHLEPVNDNREGVMARLTFVEVGPGRWQVVAAEAIPIWVDLNPAIRIVDLAAALRDPAVPDSKRRIYQAAIERINRYLTMREADKNGLIVAAP